MFKEILGDAFPLIMKAAPTIATALGSPMAGAAAMFGINLLGSAFGINPANVNELKDSILKDPDASTKLLSLEERFSEWFKSNAPQIKMPIKAELTVKLEWSDSQG